MQYISISLYRKMISCALNEGMSKEVFDWLPVPISAMDAAQAVPADVFFSLHESLDEELGPGFSVRVGLQMKIEDYGVRKSEPPFDWGKTATWAKALEGMDKAYIVYYPDLAVPGALPSIQQLTKMAKRAGLKKVVLLSGKGEREAERCEMVVTQSGLDYTLVRASWFNQNFSESFLMDPITAGFVALPMTEAKIPFVDTDDIAEVVVEALLDDTHNGKTYEITGPRAITFEEAIREIEGATGKPIAFQAVSQEEYNAAMKAAGLPDDYIWLFDYLFREVLSKPENQVVTQDVEKVLGRPATSFSAYAKETAATGIWEQTVPQSV